VIRLPFRFRTGSYGRSDDGQSLAEFALILPILLGLLVGIIEFANAWRTYQVITNVGREGARVAVLPTSTTAQVQDLIENGLDQAGLDAKAANISLGLCSGGACTGTPDTVRIDYPFQFRFVGPVIAFACHGCGGPPGTVVLSTISTMRNE
jgi:Flp pilus assembly protein TadG